MLDCFWLILFVADWSDVNPLDYLEPFLGVVTSQETSGPITGTALTSLARVFDHYIVGTALPPV